MSTEKKQYSFQTDDEQIQQFLENAENKSEILREGAKRIVLEREGIGVDDSRLTEHQADAYRWLVKRSGGNRVSIDVFKTRVAQTAQINKELVKTEILKPLVDFGYLRVDQAMQSVSIEAIPPEEIEK